MCLYSLLDDNINTLIFENPFVYKYRMPLKYRDVIRDILSKFGDYVEGKINEMYYLYDHNDFRLKGYIPINDLWRSDVIELLHGVNGCYLNDKLRDCVANNNKIIEGRTKMRGITHQKGRWRFDDECKLPCYCY